MELLQLKYFTEAARCENFSKTAAKFGVPPSDISQSIKRLERELGHELFERKANKVSLSDGGRVFLEGVTKALLELEKATAALCDEQGRGQIKILAAAVRRLVMRAVERFKRAYPEVEIIVSYGEGDDPSGFDLAVADGDFSGFGGAGEPLLRERIVLAINKSNPLSEKNITAEDLRSEAFISMGRETSFSRVGERILAEAGIEPNVSIRSEDPFYVRRCVELSLGVAVVPEVSWRGLFGDEVVLRPFCDATRETFLYMNEKKYKKNCVVTLAAMLAEECKKEASTTF